MNQQAFDAGKAALQRGDVPEAVRQLSAAKGPGEVSGAVDHQLGNCFMRMGRYADAARCYADALQDRSYGHAGALACNRGRALLAANRPQEAVASLTMAVKDEGYPTPYKAYLALGDAYKRLGNVREAGVAYRSAAIDENNPNPSAALRELGGSFMQMGRAVDAVEAYRTALDFSQPLGGQNAIYGDLGLAYVAANRMSEAVDAFAHATADGSYQLRPEVQAAYDAAQKAVRAIQGGGPSETDAFLAAAGYGAGVDPLDPTGATGEFMPSPEDTGFFSVTEAELVEQDRHDRKIRRKHKHRGLKAFLILLLLLVLVAGALGLAFYRGYGWPMQDSVVESLFSANASGGDVTPYLAAGVSDEQRAQIQTLLPTTVSSVGVSDVTRSMTSSQLTATATLPAGGAQQYHVTLVRDGIGWKVSSVEVAYASRTEDSTTVSPDSSVGTSTGTISSTTTSN
ncbi:tetratricopeptide repeat protein [Olsenella sp. HMSC062G07]|uniref:tetratricopeptide repeat protein n=1 Tax=Olsenella sp. HMSC062G07 TaxID=1739330 RepID=UPI0008A515CF|nr:tetratricopeptide repeat protein [Olsenella sp. HMSC062G07]OFK24317.1 hypothetical protein HMPREF2826_07730 [Olsenella sp. HMSC062G07]